MINFATFISESKEGSTGENPTSLAKGFMNLFNKTNHTTYVYIDDVKFKNKHGSQTGCLFISGVKGLRVNFNNGKLFSFSKWNEFAIGKTPSSELLVTDKVKRSRKELAGICPMIYNWEKQHAIPDNRRVVIVMPNQKIAWDLMTAVIDLYYEFDMTTLSEIESYILKHAPEADTDFISDTFDVIMEQEKENNDAVPTVVKAKAEEELEEEYPEQFEETTEDEPEEVETVEVEGSDEEVADDKSIVQNEQELADQLIADPLPVFEQLNSLVVNVARGFDTALLITGQGGVGKSYNVNKILSAFGTKNKDYVIMKGQSTVAAMYKFLYDNYDKICVFDDCDKVLEDSVGLNILKGALDSGKVREISWNTKGSDMVNTFGCSSHDEIEAKLAEWSAKHRGKEGTPNCFQFQGACIFISNLTPEQIAKRDEALLTRCNTVDIHLMASEVMFRMKSLIPSITVYKANGEDITNPAVKQEVFDYISSDVFLRDPRMKGKKLNFRLFNNVYKLRYGGSPKWKELAFGCC